MQIILALLIGLIFGVGLLISGMANPAKVLGFLDLAGPWDPSLAFVMAGAIAVSIIPFRIAMRRTKTFIGEPIRMPTSTVVDRRLIFGSLVFGVGWGIAGYCPGPALASLFSGGYKPVVFTVAMIAGMVIFDILESVTQSSWKMTA